MAACMRAFVRACACTWKEHVCMRTGPRSQTGPKPHTYASTSIPNANKGLHARMHAYMHVYCCRIAVYVPSRKQDSRCIHGMSIRKEATSSTNVFKDLRVHPKHTTHAPLTFPGCIHICVHAAAAPRTIAGARASARQQQQEQQQLQLQQQLTCR